MSVSADLGAAPTAVHAPLEGARRRLGTLAVSLATFMVVLDTSIANVSLPAIAGALAVSPAQATWAITSFSVANAIALPLTGWLARRFGQVRLFVASLLLFVAASWLCGLAPNVEFLIACRALQGLVAGPMFPLSQTLLLATYPPALAGTAMALWGIVTLVAPVLGPLLGGFITDHIAWSWIFFINIPVGLLAAAVTYSIYRQRDQPGQRLRLDGVGLILLVLGVGSWQLMVDLGKELDWFASPLIIGLGITSLITLAFFLAWEWTDAQPLVELRLLARRNFALGTLILATGYGLFLGNTVLLPLWTQQWLGYTASWAGAAMAPVGLLAIVLSPWVGRNITRFDPRALACVSFVGLAGVLWLRTQFQTQSTFGQIAFTTFLQGATMALYFIPLQSIILGGLQPAQLPAAAGLSTFARLVAGALGASVFTTVWQQRAALHHAQLSEAVQGGNVATAQALEQLDNLGLDLPQSLGTLNRLVDQQAYTLAANDLFAFSALLLLVLGGLVWLAKPAPTSR